MSNASPASQVSAKVSLASASALKLYSCTPCRHSDRRPVSARRKSATKSNDTVDQNTFLKLLTTQMTHQDPFSPMDNSQMVAQMAQFSSVTGIAEMNVSLKNIASDMASSRIGDAASWIGRAALVESNEASQFSDGSYAGEITLPSDVTNMNISLVDANGQTVFSKTLGAQGAGPLSFSWDGK